jgi:hypothetical protein
MRDARDLRRACVDAVEERVRMDEQRSQGRAKFVAVTPQQRVLTQPLGA